MSRWPQKHSLSTRAEALALAAEIGSLEASARLGVPAATIRRWRMLSNEHAAKAAGIVEKLTAAQLVDATEEPWPERRDKLIDTCGAGAVEAAEAARRAIAVGKARDAQHLAVACGILIDKAQLLAGGATSRSESASLHVDLTADLESVRAEIDRLQALVTRPPGEVGDG